MSFEPKIAQKAPYVLDQAAGDKKAWCSCGLSAAQPFCDGAHAREGTGMTPVVYNCETDGKKAWCGCKKTSTPPFCDGTHAKL